MALTRGATNIDGPPLSIGGPPLSIVVCSFLLKIPTRFIQSLQGDLPDNVGFRDGSNNLWQVRVEMAGGYWYFKDGWTKLVDDNKVEEGELLAYEYFSHGIFDLKVHDRSTCLTKGVGDLTRVQKVMMTDGDHCIPSYVDESQRLMDESQRLIGCFESEEVTDTDDDEVIGDINCKCVPAAAEEDDDREAMPEKNQKRTRECDAGCSAQKGKRDLDWYGEQLFKSGLAQQPNNPYFVTKKRKNRAFELFVPGDVIKVSQNRSNSARGQQRKEVSGLT